MEESLLLSAYKRLIATLQCRRFLYQVLPLLLVVTVLLIVIGQQWLPRYLYKPIIIQVYFPKDYVAPKVIPYTSQKERESYLTAHALGFQTYSDFVKGYITFDHHYRTSSMYDAIYTDDSEAYARGFDEGENAADVLFQRKWIKALRNEGVVLQNN